MLQTAPASIPWWRSRVILGALISVLSKVLVAAGAIDSLAPADEAELTNVFVLLIGGIGDAVAIGARVRQRHAPSITASP